MKRMKKNLLRIEALIIAVIMTISMFGNVNVNAAEITNDNIISVTEQENVEEIAQTLDESVSLENGDVPEDVVNDAEDENAATENLETVVEEDQNDTEVAAEEIDIIGTDEATEISLMQVDDSEYLIQAGGFEILDEVLGANVAGAQEAIYQGLKNHLSSINVASYRINVNDFEAVYYGVVNEHPELYYAATRYSCSYTSAGVTSVTPSYISGYDDDAFNRAVEKAMSVIKPGMNQLEKAVALHDYLALNVKYNWTIGNNAGIINPPNAIYTAYGALVNQDAVCQGYSLAYKLLLNKAGIDSGVVISAQMHHEWNYIVLDGDYYYVDVTWDDPMFRIGNPLKSWDIIGNVLHQNMFLSFDALRTNHYAKDEGNNVLAADWEITRNGMGTSYTVFETSSEMDEAWWQEVQTPFVWAGDNNYYYIKNWKLYEGDIEGWNQNEVCTLGYSTVNGLFLEGGRVYFARNNGLYCVEPNRTISFVMIPEENIALNGCGVNYLPKEDREVIVIQSGSKPYYYSVSYISGQNEYAVSFVDENGDELRKQYVLEGKSATAPVIEIPAGYTARWSGDFDNVQSDLTIQLILEPIVYSITYNLVKPGAVNGANPATYTIEDSITFSNPTCPGYAFNGWYDNAAYSGIAIGRINGGKTGNIELFAKWTAAKPGQPVINASPSLVLENGNILVDAGTMVTIEGEENAKVCYTIDGSNPTASSTVYTGGFVINEKTTVKAVGVRESAVGTVVSKTFDIANNEFVLQDDVTIKVGESSQVSAKILPTSKSFADIVSYSSSDNTVATISDTGVINALTEGTVTITVEITDWRGRTLQDTIEVTVVPQTYYVTFVGFGDNVIETQPVRGGRSAVAPDMSIGSRTPDGYQFHSWDKAFDVITEDITVNANFALKIYRIAFVNSEGVAPDDIYYNVTDTITLPDSSQMPMLEDKYFVGWYDNSDFEGAPILVVPSRTTGHMVLFAKWNTKATLTMEWNLEDKYLNVEDGKKVAYLPYTGKAQTPAFTVYYAGKALENKKDYTYKFVNNVNAYILDENDEKTFAKKAPALIITGKGNYVGTERVYFNITRKSIEDSDVDFIPVSLAYNKKTQKVAPVVTWNGKKLTTKELTFEYDSVEDGAYINPGAYNVKVSGKGNFEGVKPVSLEIFNTAANEADASVLIKSCKISVTPFDYADYMNRASYAVEGLTKADIISHVKVTYGKNNTVPYYEDDVDENGYDIEFVGGTVAKDIGTYTVRIWGKGIYKGETRTTFKINGLNVSTVKVDPIMAQTYDGTAKEPALNITSKAGEHLVEGTHYTLEYQKHVDVGTATVVITGINSYFGTKKVTFKINQKAILTDSEWNDVSIALVNAKTVEGHEYGCYEYIKGGVTPKLEVKFAGRILQEKVDYTLSYKNNNTATPVAGKEPYIALTLKKNIKGTKNIRFDIVRKDLDDKEINIKVNDVQESTQPGKYKSTPAIYDVNGKKLDSKDYDIEYTYEGSTTPLDKYSKPEAGKVIEVTVKGKGNYIGSKKATYRVYAKGKSIASASIKVDPEVLKKLEYSGQPVVLKETDLEVKIGKATVLVANKDYVIDGNSYVNNTNKGTAKVTIIGKGDYAGSKTISFSIKPWYLKWWIF